MSAAADHVTAASTYYLPAEYDDVQRYCKFPQSLIISPSLTISPPPMKKNNSIPGYFNEETWVNDCAMAIIIYFFDTI